MKCPKKNKYCRSILCLKQNRDYICAGINTKPTKHKEDIVLLCLKGKYVKHHKIEMTTYEALAIISVLSLTVSEGIGNG